ncbi:MAG: LegC family aminotransferase [Vulcanimicrobiota bacterium]
MCREKEMIPLSIPCFKGNEWKYVKECLDSGWVSSNGEFVEQFEKSLCNYLSVDHAIACVNGTSGLQVALRLVGVTPGDEVIVPTCTFIAPVNAVKYLQAEPIFMDCDEYLNIDVAKVLEFCRNECEMTVSGLRNKKSGRIIKAVLPVHVFGNPCDMEALMAIAEEFSLKVVEDATESLGSYYAEGRFKKRYTGTIGTLGVFSFNGNKIITTGGGGMIVTDDAALAEKARYLTTQAKDDPLRYIHNEIGYNFRLTNIQAALGVAQMEELDGFIRQKKENYELYRRLIENVNGITLMEPPPGTQSNYWFHALLLNKEVYGLTRDELMERLGRDNIQTRPLWHLNHLQKPYEKCFSYKIERAPYFMERVLNVPCSSNLTQGDVEKVIAAIRKANGASVNA